MVLRDPPHVASELSDDAFITPRYLQFNHHIASKRIHRKYVDEAPTYWKLNGGDSLLLVKTEPGFDDVQFS